MGFIFANQTRDEEHNNNNIIIITIHHDICIYIQNKEVQHRCRVTRTKEKIIYSLWLAPDQFVCSLLSSELVKLGSITLSGPRTFRGRYEMPVEKLFKRIVFFGCDYLSLFASSYT